MSLLPLARQMPAVGRLQPLQGQGRRFRRLPRFRHLRRRRMVRVALLRHHHPRPPHGSGGPGQPITPNGPPVGRPPINRPPVHPQTPNGPPPGWPPQAPPPEPQPTPPMPTPTPYGPPVGRPPIDRPQVNRPPQAPPPSPRPTSAPHPVAVSATGMGRHEAAHVIQQGRPAQTGNPTPPTAGPPATSNGRPEKPTFSP